MKQKLFLIVFLACMSFSLQAQNYSGGSGTVVDPYQIASAADLYYLRQNFSTQSNLHFIQTANITNPIIDAPTYNSYLGDFSGTYNGGGHTITGLSSLFNNLSNNAVVTNLGLINDSFNIHQEFYITGGLVNFNNGTISNCYMVTTESIFYPEVTIGGLVGINYATGIIQNCYTNVLASGWNEELTAGFVVENYGTITNCYSTGSIGSLPDDPNEIGNPHNSTSGFVAYNWGTISNSYSACYVYARTEIAAFCMSNSRSISNCFYDNEVSGEINYDLSPAIPKTTAEMQTQSTFTNASWNFATEWGAMACYPTLLWENKQTLVVAAVSQTNLVCNGGTTGSATVLASGGTGTYTYSWSPSGGTAATASGLSAGAYTCTVTDTNNCTASQSFTITQPDPITITGITSIGCPTCSDGAIDITVTGGTPPYEYYWGNTEQNNFYSNSEDISGLTGGTYYVTVYDANSCVASQNFTIIQQASHLRSSGSDNINLSNTADLKPTSQLSVEFMLKYDAEIADILLNSGPRSILGNKYNDSKGYIIELLPYIFNIDNQYAVFLNLKLDTVEPELGLNVPFFLDNQWHHIAMTYDGRYLNGYVDGVLKETVDAGANYSILYSDNETLIPLSMNGINIDELRVWNFAKTQAEILAQKDCELPSGQTGLLAYYNFNQNNAGEYVQQNDYLFDSSGNNNHGVASGNDMGIWKAGSIMQTMFSPTVTTPISYHLNETPSAFPITIGDGGSNLLWYTTATGGTGSTTAPIIDTSILGTTFYWVSTAYANGCESGREQVIVIVLQNSSDNCADAPTIPVGTTFNDYPFLIDPTTTTVSGLILPDCAFGDNPSPDSWVKFVVPASGRFIVELDNPSYQFALYNGNCDSTLNLIECPHISNNQRVYDFGNFTPGETIYIRMWRMFSGTASSYISVYDPVYNVCNATALTVGTTFEENAIWGNDVANPVSNPNAIPYPNCIDFGGTNDNWYQTTAPAGGRMVIETTNPFSVAAYKGNCDNDLSLIGCGFSYNPTLHSRIELLDLTPGETIYIRVFRANSGFDSDEAEYFVSAFVPNYSLCPTNPEVVALTVGTTFDEYDQTVDLSSAVNTGVIPSPQCSYYNSPADKWFTVIVPASGKFIVETSNPDNTEVSNGLAAYIGNCSNEDLQLLACNDYNPFSNDLGYSRLEFSGLTPGQVIYIRTWHQFSFYQTIPYQIAAYETSFNICSVTTTLPVGTTFEDEDITVDLLNLTSANPNVTPTPTCDFDGEELWFTTTVPQSGNITIGTEGTDSDTDIFMAIYTGDCNNNLVLLECLQGNGYTSTSLANLTAGSSLYIRLWGWYNEISTFQLSAYDNTLYSTTNSTNVTCNGGSNGSASVITSGGSGTYTYSWSPSGGTAASASGLVAGTYTVTVTDSNNNMTTSTVTITEPTALIASATSQTNVSCYGGLDGAATVSASGGSGNYTYSWSPNGGTETTASGLMAGTYTCIVTDANNCQTSQTFTITQPAELNNTITENAGTLTANQNGATYQWYLCPDTLLAGETNQSFTPTVSGDYRVVITSGSCFVVSTCTSFLGNTSFDRSNIVSIYPNPSTGIYTIETNHDIKLEIYDMVGKFISKKEVLVGSSTLDLLNYADGVYLIKAINTAGDTKTYKVVKRN